jgi:hypothetical protein
MLALEQLSKALTDADALEDHASALDRRAAAT